MKTSVVPYLINVATSESVIVFTTCHRVALMIRLYFLIRVQVSPSRHRDGLPWQDDLVHYGYVLDYTTLSRDFIIDKNYIGCLQASVYMLSRAFTCINNYVSLHVYSCVEISLESQCASPFMFSIFT